MRTIGEILGGCVMLFIVFGFLGWLFSINFFLGAFVLLIIIGQYY